MLNLVGRNRDKLCEGMTEQQKSDLAKYDDSVNEMYGIIEQEVFKYAFRLGAKIMLETNEVLKKSKTRTPMRSGLFYWN